MSTNTTLDLAGAVGAGQAYRKNALLLQQAQEEADMKPKVNELRRRYATGDQAAMQELAVLSPEQAKQFVDAVSGMDEMNRKKVEQRNNEIGAMAAAIISSDDPAKMYKYVRSNLSTEDQAKMPEKYDQMWVTQRLAEAKDFRAILTQPDRFQSYTVGGVTKVYRNGELVDQGPSEEELNRRKKKQEDDAETGGTGLKSSDESLMYRQVVGMFGGIHNPLTGEVSFGDPQMAVKAQRVASRATQIFRSGGKSRSESVEQAMREAQEAPPAPGRPGGKPAGKPNASSVFK